VGPVWKTGQVAGLFTWFPLDLVVGRGESQEGRAKMKRLGVGVAVLTITASIAAAAPQHGISVFGDLKYPPDFQHFDYVNPDAPKGGRLATIGTTAKDTFDSFNDFILRGDSAQGLALLFDTLMTRAYDEPDVDYGLIAKTADVAIDKDGIKRGVTFALREEAKFSDGTPVTAEDVCDTFRLMSTLASERIRPTIRDVEKCEVLGPHEVRYTFKGDNTRDLPNTIAELPVLSKAYYAKVDFSKSTLEPPLGSGPYKIGKFKQGEFVEYERRPDYWGKDLPVNRGRDNFDRVRYEYFRDRIAGFEALKAGILDLREEFVSRDWATAYTFNAVKDGRLIKEVLPDETPSGAQGFFINLRREKFQDVRVRQALNLAFDFEWSNKNLFYGSYARTESFFESSPLKATGKPTPEELAILEPYGKDLRPEVFDEAIVPPKSDGSGQDRKLLRQASKLLDEAGWVADRGVRHNAKGEALTVEILDDSPSFERVLTPYVKNLKLLGIDASFRIVDAAQGQDRLKNFDFDLTPSRFVLGLTPGSSDLRPLLSSDSAKAIGSYNLSGVANPAIDGLIDKITAAKSREELNIAGRALDRVLRAEQFWVPNWYKGSHWIAYWDIFGRPAIKPKYDRGIIDTWWVDEAKAATLKRGN
jgi:microcin C transport system substrate-binding protein